MKTLVLPKLTPRQEEFCTADGTEICFGGAVGGGKSFVARIKMVLLCYQYPGIQILLIRKTLAELRSNHVIPLITLLNAKSPNKENRFAEYKDAKKEFVFPNNSRIELGYCENANDIYRYQGNQYDVIFMEEATHFEYEVYLFLSSRNRLSDEIRTYYINKSPNNKFVPRMYFTCNPGHVGHAWVKAKFIDNPECNDGKSGIVFIPSTVYDNPHITEQDPNYLKRLEELPPKMKKALLYGDWNVFDGQFFDEFNENVHVIDPIPIRSNWKIYRARDYGFDMLACYWIAVDEYDNAYVFNELYQSGLIATAAGQKINEINNGLPIWKDLVPPDLFAKNNTDNKSPVDYWTELGQNLTKASNDRVNGWSAVREWLKIVDTEDYDGVKRPHAKLRIFRNCVNLIRTLPQLVFSQKNPNDCATEPHEITHAPDALRYYCASWTFASQPVQPQNQISWIDAWIKKTRQENENVKGVYELWD